MAANIDGGALMAAHGIFPGRAWGKHGAEFGKYLDGIKSTTGRYPHIAHIFWFMVASASYPQGGAFPAADLAEMKSRGIMPMVTLQTGVQSGGADQASYTNQSVVDGSHDTYFTQFAIDAKAFASPIILRFCHEFQHGATHPWKLKANTNGGDTDAGRKLYNDMWRHVHAIFQAQGATNVKWHWCPTNSGVSQPYYPGDQYVDYLGWDSYSSITFPWDQWNYLDAHTQWKGAYQGATNISPTKPIILGEYGVDFSGGDAARWISRYYRTCLAKYPRIVASIYFDAGGPESAFWHLDRSERKTRAYARAISLPQLDGTL